MSKISLDKIPTAPVIERTDIHKGEFSPSSVQNAQCFRKYYFEKIVKLQTTRQQTALIFGGAMHKGVEHFYTHVGKQDYDKVVRGVVDKFKETWTIEGDQKRNLETGVALLTKYCDLYKDEDVQMETVDVEENQWMKMPNGTMLLCRFDRVVQTGSCTALVDTKTTSGYLNANYWKQYENHFQTSLYYYVIEQVLGRCDYILIDAIKVPLLSSKSTSSQFERRTFARTEEQIDETLRTYSRVTDYLQAGLHLTGRKRLDHYYCNQNKCSEYGGCAFLNVCQHGIHHPDIGTTFEFNKQEDKLMLERDFSNEVPQPEKEGRQVKLENSKKAHELYLLYVDIKKCEEATAELKTAGKIHISIMDEENMKCQKDLVVPKEYSQRLVDTISTLCKDALQDIKEMAEAL